MFDKNRDRTESENKPKFEDAAPEMPSTVNGKWRLRDIILPDGIHRRVMKQYLTGAAVAVLTLWICVYYRNPAYVAGFAISGALVFFGISTKLDYAAGSIQELPVICASVTVGTFRNTTRVVFRTQEDIPSYFEFFVPGRLRNTFLPNYAYVIYFKQDTPKSLLGFTQI